MINKIEIQTERKFWADKFMDLANLGFVTLVLSQGIVEKINWQAIILGVILYITLAILSRFLQRR